MSVLRTIVSSAYIESKTLSVGEGWYIYGRDMSEEKIEYSMGPRLLPCPALEVSPAWSFTSKVLFVR